MYIIKSILFFPIQVLFYPFKVIMDSLMRSGFDQAYESDDDLDAMPSGLIARVGALARRFLMALLRVPIFILQSPFLILRAIFLGGKRDLLFLLPAVLTVGFMGFVFFQVFANTNRIHNRYRLGAIKAIQDGNLELAKTYFNRVVSESKLTEWDQFQWAVILYQTNEKERSQRILDELAPDDQPRYAPAHRMKAIWLAAQLGNASDPLTLRKLRHHLENSDDDSIELKQAWVAYYLAVDQADQAIDYLRDVSELNPQYLLMIANIYERKGLIKQQNEALEKAEIAYREILAKDPLASAKRITLAYVLVQRKQFDQAEQLLSKGLQLQPDPMIKRAAADFYVMGYDLAVKEGKGFGEQFAYLERALALDSNHAPVYQRLVSLHQQKLTVADAEKIKTALLESVAGDKPSAMAHLALSNLLWAEGNHSESEWHVEQAYKLQPKFAIVLNNLAWMLAHKEEPDLERALLLAETALKQSPNDPHCLGTYGTVLLFQKKYEDAIIPLQKALSNNQNAKPIHEALAKCYQEMGKSELAEIHLKKATGLNDKLGN